MALVIDAGVGVHGAPTAERRVAVADESAALTLSAQADLLVVEKLFDRVCVVHLDGVELLGAEAGLLVCSERGASGHLRRPDQCAGKQMSLDVALGVRLGGGDTDRSAAARAVPKP